MRVAFLDDFDDLRRRMPAPDASAFPCGPEWLVRLHSLGMPADTPLVLALSEADDGSAMCWPLIRRDADAVSLSNYYSPLWEPMLWQGERLDRVAHATAIGRALRTMDRRPATVHLQPLAEGKCADALNLGLRAAGYLASAHFAFGNWFLPSRDLRFAAYFAARPAALRNTIARARRRLDKAGEWCIRIHCEPSEETNAAIDAFESIYRNSWKPAESYPGFVREMCRWAADRRMLRLGVLSRANRPVASQIWLLDNGTASIFKLAYEPDAAKFSPGSVLTAALMEHALDVDLANEIDYLSGDDAYKKDWMTHRRVRHGLVAFEPRSTRGLLAAARHFGGRALHRLNQAGPT